MIFLIDNTGNQKVVNVYEDIWELTNSVDWQDILNDALTIVDEHGKIYKWDKSKTNEIGTVYGYSLEEIGMNEHLGLQCVERYKNKNHPTEFVL